MAYPWYAGNGAATAAMARLSDRLGISIRIAAWEYCNCNEASLPYFMLAIVASHPLPEAEFSQTIHLNSSNSQ